MIKGGKNARTGIDRLEAHGRLRKAKAFHLVARESIGILRDAGLDRAPVLSNAVLTAVAYTDAVTIASDGKVNQRDHATAPAVLRECVGRELPEGPLSDLKGVLSVKGMLSVKDEMQYGARVSLHNDAERALEQLDRFAAWASSWLEAKGIS